MRTPYGTAALPTSPAEFVNMREPSMDMKSVTDRAAQTLLWTELVRGGPWGRGARWAGDGHRGVREERPFPPCLCCPQAWA